MNNTFGGIIYECDFSTENYEEYHTLSAIAYRIMQDQEFDEQCKRNIKNRKSRGE